MPGTGRNSDQGNDVYLASYDAGDDDVDGWSINSIPGKINASKCGRVLWLIDCCYSGQAGLAITRQSKGPAYAAITSSAASESSTEHWTFTEALLDALRGVSYVDLNHDGTVTLAEFATHVEADMNAAEEQRSAFEHTKGFDPEMVAGRGEAAGEPADRRTGESAGQRRRSLRLPHHRCAEGRSSEFTSSATRTMKTSGSRRKISNRIKAGRLRERDEGGSALEKALVPGDRLANERRRAPDPLHRLRGEVGRVGALAPDPRAEVVTLFVTQRVDRIELRGFARRIKSEKHADCRAHHERDYN